MFRLVTSILRHSVTVTISVIFRTHSLTQLSVGTPECRVKSRIYALHKISPDQPIWYQSKAPTKEYWKRLEFPIASDRGLSRRSGKLRCRPEEMLMLVTSSSSSTQLVVICEMSLCTADMFCDALEILKRLVLSSGRFTNAFVKMPWN